MFFINTEELRKQAGDLKEYKRKYMQLIATLEEVLIWIQKNEFRDAEPIITTMEQQKKALEEQKYILCIVLIMLAVHSFSDPQLFDLKYDPFLILIGTAILKKAPLPLKNPVGGRSFAD